MPYVIPVILVDVSEVVNVHDIPSVEVRILPELPTVTKKLIIVNDDILSELLIFPAESAILIVQSTYVPILKAIRVIVLFPLVADVVPDEQEPQ